MTEALDTDTALDNPDAPWLYEPYYYLDNASHAVSLAQKKREQDYGNHANDDLVWGVKKVPRKRITPGK